MSALLEPRSPEQIAQDADNAVKIILARFDAVVVPCLEQTLRQAYLLGRTDEAARNFDDVIKRARGEA